MGLWACSGHVPNALSMLAGPERGYLQCAALCFGYMLDLDDSTAVGRPAGHLRAGRSAGFLDSGGTRGT